MQGFAYAEFDSAEALDKAVAKSGVSFKGRKLFIAVSRPKGSGARGGLQGRGRSYADPSSRGMSQNHTLSISLRAGVSGIIILSAATAILADDLQLC